MNQSEFLAITCKLLKAKENSRLQGCEWYWFFFSLVELLAQDFTANHKSYESQNFFRQSFENCPLTAVIIIIFNTIISSVVIIKIPSILINNTDILQEKWMEKSWKCHWTLKNVQTFRAEPFISVKKPIVPSWHTPHEKILLMFNDTFKIFPFTFPVFIVSRIIFQFFDMTSSCLASRR